MSGKTETNENRGLESPETFLAAARAHTQARIFLGRASLAYRTSDWLNLRRDHAQALDAVHAEMDLLRDFGEIFLRRWRLFEVRTQAAHKEEYLRRPDLGRLFSDAARVEITAKCSAGADIQVVIGDGLSPAALRAQVPTLLPLLLAEVDASGLRVGQMFCIRYCRVGIMNEIGELLDPGVVVLLIGERPGLATAASLSAYLAYRPRAGDTDARRSLISNIHVRGIDVDEAAKRIAALANKMLLLRTSGVSIKEDSGTFLPADPG